MRGKSQLNKPQCGIYFPREIASANHLSRSGEATAGAKSSDLEQRTRGKVLSYFSSSLLVSLALGSVHPAPLRRPHPLSIVARHRLPSPCSLLACRLFRHGSSRCCCCFRLGVAASAFPCACAAGRSFFTRSFFLRFGWPVNSSPDSRFTKVLLQFSSLDASAALFRLAKDVCCSIFVVPILETVAAHCAVPPPGYLCEVDGDGHVLAGVEIEIPGDGVLVMPQKKFFWSSGCQGFADTFEEAALQAIKFLQGLYGFIVRDYNHECVVVYRNSGNAAIAVAASAVRYAAYLERTLASTRSSSPNPAINVFRGQPQPPPNLALLYSILLASLCSI